MANSHPHNPPSKPQLKLLRDLALETGSSFAYPSTGAEASAEIGRLLATKRTSSAERRREAREIRADLAEQSGGASRVRDEELGGYGSTAGWS
jgi:hypothetical protein